MIGGAGTIIGLVLGIIVESRVVAFLMGVEVVLGCGGFVTGLLAWTSGWILRED